MSTYKEIVLLGNFIRKEFNPSKVKNVEGELLYETHTSKPIALKKLEEFFKERFGEVAKEVEEKRLEYQIFIRAKPMLVVEETVGKTLVVYSDGTVWLHMVKDPQEANRILQFISPEIERAENKDLSKLCGERGLSRWSYIRRGTEGKPEVFAKKISELLNRTHYSGAETRRILGSFGVKYMEQRSIRIVPTDKGTSVQIAMKDLFCQGTDLLKIAIDFLSFTN